MSTQECPVHSGRVGQDSRTLVAVDEECWRGVGQWKNGRRPTGWTCPSLERVGISPDVKSAFGAAVNRTDDPAAVLVATSTALRAGQPCRTAPGWRLVHKEHRSGHSSVDGVVIDRHCEVSPAIINNHNHCVVFVHFSFDSSRTVGKAGISSDRTNLEGADRPIGFRGGSFGRSGQQQRQSTLSLDGVREQRNCSNSRKHPLLWAKVVGDALVLGRGSRNGFRSRNCILRIRLGFVFIPERKLHSAQYDREATNRPIHLLFCS